MAGSICDYLENALLNHAMMKSAFTPAAHLYLGLSSTAIADDGTGYTEPAAGSYARVEVDPADWTAATARALLTAVTKTFPTATASWGNGLTDWFLIDSSSGAGNAYAAGQLTDSLLLTGTGATTNSAPGTTLTYATGGLNAVVVDGHSRVQITAGSTGVTLGQYAISAHSDTTLTLGSSPGASLTGVGFTIITGVTVTTNDVYQVPATNLSITFSAGGVSTYLADKLLNLAFKGTAFTQPSNIYIALSTANPTDDASGLAEVSTSGTAYARKSTAAGDWGTVSGGQIANANALAYAQATGAGWGTIAYEAQFDNSTGGNMLFYGPLAVSKAVAAGNTFNWPVGALINSIS